MRIRAGGKDDIPGTPPPLLPLLSCKQASASMRQGAREGLTCFRGLWSIKGLHRNSKTTPAISTTVVCCVLVDGKCVWHTFNSASLVVCVDEFESFISPVAAAEQKPQDLASSLVLFFS